MSGINTDELGTATLAGAGQRPLTRIRPARRRTNVNVDELRRQLEEITQAGPTGGDITAEAREGLPLLGGVPTVGYTPPPPPPTAQPTTTKTTTTTTQPRGPQNGTRTTTKKRTSVPKPRPKPSVPKPRPKPVI